MIGRTLSHYEITEQLGAGGMGEVYLARDTKLDRRVALKLLPADVAADSSRLRRLQREARALAALDHPNIVTVFSVEESEGLHFLTMAHVEGETLGALLPAEGLPLERLLELAVPLADALRAAHERGIIHRDLKPANVMVDGEGRLRVLDFGLARVVQAIPTPSQVATRVRPEPVTVRGMVLGTMPYMSPEQAEGKRVGASSDIFSLGVVLYEMATGRRPFGGETEASLVSSILRDTPTSVMDLRPELPEPLDRVIQRCLEKATEDRYASAEAVRDALETLRQGVLAGTVSGMAKVLSRPRRRFAALAAAVLVAVAAGVGTVVWRGGKEPAEKAQEPVVEAVAPQIRSIAVLPLRNLSGDPEQEYFVDGMTEALITDLSKIGALKVIARSSVMRYKGSATPLADIAAALGVDAIVEGSIVREGEQVRITAQLIEAATEQVLWGEQYTRDLTSILALQVEMATAIAGEVQVALSSEETAQLSALGTVEPAAYDAVLKGQFNLQQFTPWGFDAALEHFERALEIAPDYAPAYVGVSQVWTYRTQWGLASPGEGARVRRENITRALELDDSLPDAHLELAIFRAWYEWDWAGGEEAFRRAIELNSSYAAARIFYSHFLTVVDRAAEGTVEAERALELDPLNPFFRVLAANQLLMAGRIEEGIARLRQILDEIPSLGIGHEPLWAFYHQEGLLEEAFAEAVAAATSWGEQDTLEALERGWQEGGYDQAMRQATDLLERRARSAWVSPSDLAVMNAYVGRTERVFYWLEKGLEVRDAGLPYFSTMMATLMYSTEIRNDPRFRDLLRRMSFPGGEPASLLPTR